MEKYLYEFCTGDNREFVFVVADSPERAIKLARKKTKQEGHKYKFRGDDVVMKIKVDDEVEIGVHEYINSREY